MGIIAFVLQMMKLMLTVYSTDSNLKLYDVRSHTHSTHCFLVSCLYRPVRSTLLQEWFLTVCLRVTWAAVRKNHGLTHGIRTSGAGTHHLPW